MEIDLLVRGTMQDSHLDAYRGPLSPESCTARGLVGYLAVFAIVAAVATAPNFVLSVALGALVRPPVAKALSRWKPTGPAGPIRRPPRSAEDL